MPNIHKVDSALSQHQAGSSNLSSSTPISRNVSFAKDSNESTAYREHNPPTVLRRQEAARRGSQSPETPAQDDRFDRPRTPVFQLGSVREDDDSGSSRAHSPAPRNPRSDTAYTSAFTPTHAPFNNNNGSSNSIANTGDKLEPSFMSSSSICSPTQGQKVAGGTGTGTGGTSKLRSFSPHYNLETKSTTAANRAGASSASNSRSASISGDAEKQYEVHILVAVTGSVATIKLPQIIHKLKQIYRKRAAIQVVVTKASTTFFDPTDIPRDIKIWYDSDEWRSRQTPAQFSSESLSHSDQQLHIRLRRWADILLVAPCSANTLAKFTYGICDNLLTSIFRVWNPEVPIILAPAMNTHMYTNPVTKLHFNILKEFYPFVEILKPIEKVLVCGDIGMGGMREWTDIVQILVRRLGMNEEDETDEDDDEDEDEDEDKRRSKKVTTAAAH